MPQQPGSADMAAAVDVHRIAFDERLAWPAGRIGIHVAADRSRR